MDNATAISNTGQQNVGPHSNVRPSALAHENDIIRDDNETVQSTSEKGFLDALRDGLSFIDNNSPHIERIFNETNSTLNTNANNINNKTVADDDEFSLLDLFLSDEKIFSVPGDDPNHKKTESMLSTTEPSSPAKMPNSPMRIRPVLPDGMKNETIKFALLPMSLYNMVTNEGNILFDAANVTVSTPKANFTISEENQTSAISGSEQSIEFEMEVTTYIPSVDTTLVPQRQTTADDHIENSTTDEYYSAETTEYSDYSTVMSNETYESTYDDDYTEASTMAATTMFSSTDDILSKESTLQDIIGNTNSAITGNTANKVTTEKVLLTTTQATTDSITSAALNVQQTTSDTTQRINNLKGTIEPITEPVKDKINVTSTRKPEQVRPLSTTRPIPITTSTIKTTTTTSTSTIGTTTKKPQPAMETKESVQHLDDDGGSVFSAFLEGFSSALLKTNFSKISDKLDIEDGVITHAESTTHSNKISTPKLSTTETAEIVTIRPSPRPPVPPTKTATTAPPKINSIKSASTTIRLPEKITKITKITSTATQQSLTTTTNRNIQKHPTEKPLIINSNPSILDVDINYDYDEPTLPPSLPNLKIIPFLPTDAVKIVPKGGNTNRDKLKYDYYRPPVTNLAENKPPTYIEKYPVYSVDSINDRIDYDVYKPDIENKENPNYSNVFSSSGNKVMNTANVNVNSKIDFELFDHTAYPPITKDPTSIDKNSVDKYPYENGYDYDSYNLPPPKIRPNFDLKLSYYPNNGNNNNNNRYTTGQIYHQDDSYRVPEFEKFATIYPDKHIGFSGTAEHKTENPINMNQFSPPQKTEGNDFYS